MTEYREFLIAGEKAASKYCINIPREALHGATGTHLGSTAGSSLDFRDYREYEPGDDLRRIDWSAYARSDKLIVKLYREEVTPHIDIAVDLSSSMDMKESRKAEALLGLSALLASAASNGGASHSGWMFSDGLFRIPNGTRQPSEWDGISFKSRVSPHEAVSMGAQGFKRRGIRVLISDLMWEDNPADFLRTFVHGAAAVIIIQLLTDEEIKPGLQGNHRLIDIESEEESEIFIDSLMRDRYMQMLSEHQSHWKSACRQAGASFMTLSADSLIESDWSLTDLEKGGILSLI